MFVVLSVVRLGRVPEKTLLTAVPNLIRRSFFVPDLNWSNMDPSPGKVVQVELLERQVIIGPPFNDRPPVDRNIESAHGRRHGFKAHACVDCVPFVRQGIFDEVRKKSHTAVRTSSRDQRETKGARCWAIITQLSINGACVVYRGRGPRSRVTGFLHFEKRSV